MQQGEYAAKLIQKRLAGNNNTLPPFRYTDAGSLAVIGRNAAVVNLNFARFSGFIAWLIWVFVHIYYLVEFDNKLVVMIQWGWNYFTRKSGARLITDTVLQQKIEASHNGNGNVAVNIADVPIESQLKVKV